MKREGERESIDTFSFLVTGTINEEVMEREERDFKKFLTGGIIWTCIAYSIELLLADLARQSHQRIII